MIEAVGLRPVAPDEAADLPGEQRSKTEQERNAGEFADQDGANQQAGHRRGDQRQQYQCGDVYARSEAADQLGVAAGRLHAPVQFDDEGAIVAILRRHQHRGLPAGRQQRDTPEIRAFDVGAKPARLHRYRAERQADSGDGGVGPQAGLATDAPCQPLIGQFEPMRGADQRCLVGVLNGGSGVRLMCRLVLFVILQWL